MASSRFVVLVPLYIYPLEGAWEPLLRSAQAHPDIRFLAVINPSNGPGDTPLPDASYQASLRQLSAIPNIEPIGYVHCTYSQRDAEAVQRDIDLYVGWNSDGALRMDGIFIDEAPSHPDHMPYMTALAEHANRTWQANLGREAITVYNPGVVPNPAYFDAADYVVSFEQSEEHWNLDSVKQTLASLSPAHCSKSIAIVHSCTGQSDSPEDGVRDLVRQIKGLGFAGLYATHQVGGGFTNWPQSWDRLLEAAVEEA